MTADMKGDMDGPHALLVVQERDTEADQLRHRRAHLPARASLQQVSASLDAAARDGAAATQERDELARRQSQFEAELTDLEGRAADLDRKMHSGVVTAARDLQAMADQLDGLKRRKSSVEDSELEVMEALEPVEERVAQLQDRFAALDADAIRLRAEVAEAEVEIDKEIAEVASARAAAAEGIPAELMSTYERLRQRLGGVGAAPLVGSSCGGCHLVLSAVEVDRIRHLPADAVVLCEQCGRILVR